jgi:amino acid adenylation domain-containing protein
MTMNCWQDLGHSTGLPHHAFAPGEIEQSIAARFERQVAAFPDRIAVKTLSRTTTYRDLNRAANRVAQAILRQRGDREEPIAFLVEQGADAIVMLLGALKAGKFYVPLDASYPQTHLTAVVRHARPPLILTNTRNQSLAAAVAERTCGLVNCDLLDDGESGENPGLTLSADRTGYLLYTSGSSGSPKGVTHSQRSILHQIMGYSNGLRISPDDRLTLFHSHAFSASRLEIFGALLNGAAVLPFPVAEAGIPNLIDWLGREQVTIAHWIPTLFRHVAEALEGDEDFPRLRMIVLGSEPAQPRDIVSYQQHFARTCTLVNRFGTTETGNICWQFFDRHAAIPSRRVPVGLAVSGVEVLVTDERGHAVAVGVVGEICVRSRYLSPGYWQSPELTQAAFLADPDGGDRRIYRTGDLGRLRPDGSLEHLGRRDGQVKINGFRVEMRAIEQMISRHPGVRECAVDVVQDSHEESRLVAYVVPANSRSVDGGEIRRYLAATLPVYMLPAAIRTVDTLPRTPNGKLDRAALAKMRRESGLDKDRASTDLKVSSPPRDPTEQMLTVLWAALLGLATVSVTDNFFDLGGNSLLAAQLMVGIQKTFGMALLPAAIFAAPTVERLAALLRGAPDPDRPSLLPLQPHGSKTPCFWVHGDASNALLPQYLGPDQPVYGLEHQGTDGSVATCTTAESIAEYYLRQIRTVQPQGPYRLGGYSFGGAIAFEIAQRLEREGQTVSLLVMLDSLFPGVDVPESSLTEDHDGRSSVASSMPRSHLQRLAKLGPREQFAYILVRLKAKWDEWLGTPVRRSRMRLICRLYLRMGWTLPVSVRSFYILGIYKRALSVYTPTSFAGSVLYVKSRNRPAVHLERWKRVMTGPVDVCEVHGGHLDVISRENAAVWAPRLTSRLSNLQIHQG